MNQIIANILCVGLLGSAAPAFGQNIDASGEPVDPTRDPLYWQNHLPGTQRDATGMPATQQGGDQGSVAGEPGCVACADFEEGEANCAVPTDTVNGGCNSDPPVYGSLQCGHDFCGTFAFDGETRDTDWWMFEIEQTSEVRVSVVADVPVQVAFGNLSTGCPIASLMGGVFGDACIPTIIGLTLDPGTYVVFVAPRFGDPVPCGARYLGNLTCDALGACCLGKGACAILTSGACSSQGGEYVGAGATCASCVPPCPPGPRGDTNCDNHIDFFDIDPFLLALFEPPTYMATFCGGSICAADVDCSNVVDFFDVDPFLGCLFGGCPACP